MQSSTFPVDLDDFEQSTFPVDLDDLDVWTPWQQVNSSNVGAVRYHNGKKLLQVAFLNGSKYEYSDVERTTFENFLGAPSKGKFLHYAIKKFDYPYRQV